MARLEPAVPYKRLLKRTMISSLRTVFSEEYPDPQLRSMNITTDHPLKREQFPCIVVEYDESSVKNAGISHIEYLQNSTTFADVPARHFMFEGSFTFKCFALTPLDRDVLSDSLVDLLAFGKLDSLLNRFFEIVYSEVPDSAQITLYSDYMDGLGESTSSTEWGSEDGLIYSTGYRIGCSGGFYNSIKQGIAEYIEEIIVYGNDQFHKEQEVLTDITGRNSPNPFYIRGKGVVSSVNG
jgi:hypothetical protein